MASSRKSSPFKSLQKSARQTVRRLTQAPGASWKKVSRNLRHSRRENLKEIGSLQRDYTQNARWQMKNLFKTYQATLWRPLALVFGALALAGIVGMVLMYFRYTPARPLVTIGGHVIPRGEYLAKLDEVAGRPVLTKIVYSDLVRQAATKAGLMPTPAQIDARLADMQRRGQTLPPGDSVSDLRDGVALDIALENLRIAGVTVTDAEIADVYKRNTAKLTVPAQVQSILVVTQSAFAAQAAAGLLAKGETAAQVAAQPEMHVDGENGYHLNLSGLPPTLHDKIVNMALGMKPGQITTLPVANAFLIVKCLQKAPAHLPALPEIKDQLARAIKLQKAPSAAVEMVTLYKANKPSFDMDRYATYFSDIDRAQITPAPAAPKTASVP